MRIYTEVVWSWDDEKGELVRESSKSYDYDGPLTLFSEASERNSSNPAATTGANYRDGTGDSFVYPAGGGYYWADRVSSLYKIYCKKVIYIYTI